VKQNSTVFCVRIKI